MFIISKDGSIIHGPIRPKVIYDNVYASDIIDSKDVMIVVKSSIENYEAFTININGVCQGIPQLLSMRNWQDAADCNIDVNCPQGNSWQNERDAVALVLINGVHQCSGALLNNPCQDLRPFFLTAFHCLDSDENKQLNTQEKDLNIYAFRFKYEAGTPQCPGNSTGTQGTWITYSGALFRAASAASDFALIELNGSIANQPDIALAGWNRNSNTPFGIVTTIHHPKGDAKKISDDDEILNTTNPNMWIVERWDHGLVEPGSSGAPLFNSSNNIIGQLNGGKNNIGCNPNTGESLIDSNKFGRFNLSWTGGGTNDTRLSNWLGAVNPPATTNTIRVPSVSTVGNNLVCTTNKQFTLTNPISGSTISWSVSNPGLFATTVGASTSGTGSIATLRANSGITSGSAVLTFTLSQGGCNDVTITQTIWVGLPDFDLNYLDEICLGGLEIASLDLYGVYGISLGSIEWTFDGSITGVGSTAIARYRGVSPGWGSICVKATNGCGETTKCYWVYVNECDKAIIVNENNIFSFTQNEGKISFEVRPNPFSGSFTFSIPDFNIKSNQILTIYDLTGRTVLQQTINENNIPIDLDAYNAGLYFIQYRKGNQILTKKIIKI